MEIKYTKGQLIEAIKNKQKELGRTPTLYDFENIPIAALITLAFQAKIKIAPAPNMSEKTNVKIKT